MKAIRYMRIPFIALGYEVTEDNLDAIAKWCEGFVIRTDEARPFVRVPVNRPTNQNQTKAYVGTYVLVTEHRGENNFKVYTKAMLERHFMIVPPGIEDEVPQVDDMVSPVIDVVTPCCHHNGVGANVRALPTQQNGHRNPQQFRTAH